jgi:hypothetical protein
MEWANKGKRENRIGGTAFLARWEKAAAERRRRLEEVLAAGPVSAARLAELQSWQKSIAAKKAWLLARLEHVSEVEKLLEKALAQKKH